MIFLNEHEYKIIRNLAWDILIDSGVSRLPVDIAAIARVYQITSYDTNRGLFYSALQVSSSALTVFGLSGEDNASYLAVRILAPIVVLDAVHVMSPKDVSVLTGLPMEVAAKRFHRLQELQKRGTIGMSRLERLVLSRFQPWVNETVQGR